MAGRCCLPLSRRRGCLLAWWPQLLTCISASPPPPLPQVHHLNRELLAERTKVKALGEELENPLNVHR